MGKHSIKTGFEGRFYYLESDSPDGTATYNFNSAQTNLPGFDHADGACLRELPAGRGADLEPACPDRQQFLLPEQLRLLRAGRLQGVVQAHAQPGRPLADSAGHDEKNGYVTNLDLTLPNAAAGNRPGALRFADQEGEKTFIDTYYGQVQPRLGVAYAVSPQMAISAGYSSSNRPAHGLQRRRELRHA